MRLFRLDRRRDLNGNSGVGLVAEGVQFSNGRVVLQWLSTISSTAVFDNIHDLIRIHCRKGHETGIVWDIDSEFVPIAGARCERCSSGLENSLDFVREKGLYYHLKCWSSEKRDRLQRQKVENGTHNPQKSVTRSEMWAVDAEEIPSRSTRRKHKEVGGLSKG